MQFHHHRACLFLGKIVLCRLSIPEKDLSFSLLHCHSETNLHIRPEGVFAFFFVQFLFKATHLTSSNLVTLMKCSLGSQRTYPVEVWKLFFQKASDALDQALVTFSSMVNPMPRSHKLYVSLCEFHVKAKCWGFFFDCRPPTTATHPYHMPLRLLDR